MKQYLIPVLAIALVAATGVGMASAHGAFGDKTAVVEKLAARFDVDPSEIGAAFEELRAEHQATMQAKLETRLDAAVASGEITAEQKTAILAKHEERRGEHNASHETWAELTPEERKVAREARRADMTQWMADNGLEDFRFMGDANLGADGHGPRGLGQFNR